MAGKEQQVAELERKAAEPTLWDSPMEAQRLLRRLSALKEEVDTWRREEQAAASLAELVVMAAQEDDADLAQDLAQEAREVEERLRALERPVSREELLREIRTTQEALRRLERRMDDN